MSRRPAPKYPAELRERAVRMVFELTPGRGRWGAIEDVSAQLGIGTAESLRRWVKQAEIDGGEQPGMTTEERAELRRLRRENAELRRANEILKTASAFFASAELDRRMGK